MTTMTRRYRFSASHRLHVTSLSDEQNGELFGKCNNPYGHGHDYVVSVTVAGPVDPLTGLIVSPYKLDRLLEEKVLPQFAHKNLNSDLPQFRALVPTTENLANVIADLVESHWAEYFSIGTRATATKIHVQETDRNSFELLISSDRRLSPSLYKDGSVAVNA